MSKEINILNSNKEDIKDAESLKQLEFINKAKEYVSSMEKELGRKLTACVVTFGCQMNTEHGKRKAAKTAAFFLWCSF